MKMKLSSRKELLNEAESTLKSIKKSLNEDSTIGSLFYKVVNNVIDKDRSDRKDILLPYTRNIFVKMKDAVKKQKMSDDKMKMSLNILDKVERETITKVGNFQLKSFSEIEEYILIGISTQIQKQM